MMQVGDTFKLSNGTAFKCIGRAERDGAFYLEPLTANALESTDRHKGFLNDEAPLDLPEFNFEGQGATGESQQDDDRANEPLVMPSMF
jgi:hypothetical protein